MHFYCLKYFFSKTYGDGKLITSDHKRSFKKIIKFRGGEKKRFTHLRLHLEPI